MTFGSVFSGIGGIWYNPPMPSGSKPKVYPQDMVEKVKAMYSSGSTQTEIAIAIGCTQRVIWRLMRRHSIPARVAAKRNQRGDKNHMWKGDDACYTAFHNRMTELRGQPKACEICGTMDEAKTYDWANLTGRYSDPSDYKRMCRSCHWKYDLKHKNLGRYAVSKEVQNAS